MNPSEDALLEYCQKHSSAESDVLKELERTTHLTKLEPEMLAGFIQGRFLSFVSKWIRPNHILEIGTYTGYSSQCLAEGLQPDGKLITIEVNPENENLILSTLEKSKLKPKIELIIGDAFDKVPTLEEDYFDLIFIDGAKKHYCEFYDLVFSKLKVDGTILVDNVLWYGNILNTKMNKTTQSIDTFNKKVAADPRVENVLLPLRDGLQLIRKLSD